MMNWKNVDLNGGARISRVVSIFEIEDHLRMPYGKYKIKILENMDGSYTGCPNVAYKDENGFPDWIGGYGANEIEALQDAIKNLTANIPPVCFCDASKFEWAAPEDF